jgi:hypothetical protein
LRIIKVKKMKKNDLTVKGESIERAYTNYCFDKYKVNRRYQRKLVWGIEEKISFIDSIINSFPVPIILLAESEVEATNSIEIIDGMQRLNAIFSFVENEFSVNGEYFDLNSMATTKSRLDAGLLVQKAPVMERSVCVAFSGYEIPVSIFEFNLPSDVDEVFRRINSGGRQLSRQELRAAGSLDDFATAVRKIAAKVRGDDSHSDVLPLNNMKLISVTGKELGYGILVDTVFWVANGILVKEDVRQSLDEQLVAEILAYMVLDEPPPGRSEYLDDYFGLGVTEASPKRFDEINLAVRKRGLEQVIKDFIHVLDVIKLVVSEAGVPLTTLLFGAGAQSKAPRVFQVVFLALHELLIKRNMRHQDLAKLVRKMRNSGGNIVVQEGGRWGAEHRQNSIAAYCGIIAPLFRKNKVSDPATTHWISQLQNILTQSFTEQASYDFKQGFFTLSKAPKFDKSSFEKVLQTCVGIANLSPKSCGYVIIGVADGEATAKRVEQLFKVSALPFNDFYITGIAHEAAADGKSLDQFFQDLVVKIRSSALSDDLRSQILRDIKLIKYFDKAVVVIEIVAQDDPSSYDDDYYIREGANLRVLEKKELASLFKRFSLKE